MAKHADAHDAHRPNVKLFMAVFAALLALTGITVWISTFRLQRHEAVALGLLVAAAKAGLVAAVFMHLWGENRFVHRVLCVAAFFGVLLALVLIDARWTLPRLAQRAPVAEQHPDEGGR